MPTLDLLDRLLEHDAWTTRRVLEFAQTLTDEQLDQDFDIGHRTVRETLQHVIGNIEVWTDLMVARPVRQTPTDGPSLVELRRRFEAAFRDFAQVAREARDAGRLGDRYVDVLDQPRRRSPTPEPSCMSSRMTTCTGPRYSTCFNVWASRA